VKDVLLSLFYRWGNWNFEGLRDKAKAIGEVISESGPEMWIWEDSFLWQGVLNVVYVFFLLGPMLC